MARRPLRIENPVAGRCFGVVWDLLITAVSLLLIPIGCLMLAAGLMETSLLLTALAAPLIVIAVFSLAFGVVWNFRRYLEG